MFERYFTPTKPNKAVKVNFTYIPCDQTHTHQNVVCVYYNMFKLLETHGSCIEAVGDYFAPILPCYQFISNLSHHLCIVWGLGSLGEVTTWYLQALKEYVKEVSDDTPQAWMDLIATYCVAKRFADKFRYNETRKHGLSLVHTCQNKCKHLGHGFQAYLLEIMFTMTKACIYTTSLSELYKENSNLLLVYQHEHGQGIPYTLTVQFSDNEPGYELPVTVSEISNLINYGYLVELALKFCKPKDEMLKRSKDLITARTEYNSIYQEHMKHTLTNELKLNYSRKYWDNTTLRVYTKQYIDNIMCLAQTEYKELVPLYTNFTLTWLAKQCGTLPPERFNTISSLVWQSSGGFFTEKELLVLLSYYNTESREQFTNVVYNLINNLSRSVTAKPYMVFNLPYTPPSFQYLTRYLITTKFLLENSVLELKERSVQAQVSELSDLLLELSYTCVDLARPNDPTAPYYLAAAAVATYKHTTYGCKKIPLSAIASAEQGSEEGHNPLWEVEKEAFHRLCRVVDWGKLKKDQETVDQSMVWVAPALLSTENLYDYVADLNHVNDTPQEVKQLLFIHNEPIHWKEKVERVLDYYENNPVNTKYMVELFVSTLLLVLGYYMILVDNPQLTKRLLKVCRKLLEYLFDMCIQAYKSDNVSSFFKGLKTNLSSVPLHVFAAMRASEHMCYQGGKPC